MMLSEISVDGQEPLLIVMLQKLLSKDNTRVWLKGQFARLQVKGIGSVVVDQARYLEREEYHGKAYEIKVHGGMGTIIAPPDADGWELARLEDDDKQNWELKRVKR
jgi:hypothetical protein